MQRRKFIQSATGATAALLLNALEPFAANINGEPAQKGYGLKIMATNWGFEGSMDAFCARVKKEGYDGIEHWWPDDLKEQNEMFAALRHHQLEVGFLLGGWQSNPAEHLSYYKKVIDTAARQKIQKPVYINNHSGRDFFSFTDNRKFIDHTTALAKETGIPIYHETHRGRMLFAAHITRQYIEQIPELRLTLDISHWCNVHESLLEDQADTVGKALERTDHIHARIGHAQGAQVNDPRAPEWDYCVKKHFEWWDRVVNEKKKKGLPVSFLTEFGPPDYMPTTAYTRQPLANQWDINVYMLQLLRKRYAS
jgi:sugar phosphate isomerase/epimerase